LSAEEKKAAEDLEEILGLQNLLDRLDKKRGVDGAGLPREGPAKKKTQLKRASAVAWVRLYFFCGRQAREK
jgi:hypothetical protein